MKFVVVLMPFFFLVENFAICQGCTIEERIEAMESFVNYPDSVNENRMIEYLNYFPQNYKELDFVFNRNESAIANPQAHIDYFYFCSGKVKDSIFFEHLFSLTMGASWNSDAINYFQNKLKENIKINLSTYIPMFEEKSNAELRSFFYFFFDNPSGVYPNDIPSYLNDLNKNSRIKRILVSTFENVKQDNQ